MCGWPASRIFETEAGPEQAFVLIAKNSNTATETDYIFGMTKGMKYWFVITGRFLIYEVETPADHGDLADNIWFYRKANGEDG